MSGIQGNHMAGNIFGHQLAYKLQAAAVKADLLFNGHIPQSDAVYFYVSGYVQFIIKVNL